MAPDLNVLTFPAWDCLPYDRVSPIPEIVSRRVATLASLSEAENGSGPEIVLTTVSAVLQRVAPRSAFAGRTVTIRPGDTMPPGDLAEDAPTTDSGLAVRDDSQYGQMGRRVKASFGRLLGR